MLIIKTKKKKKPKHKRNKMKGRMYQRNNKPTIEQKIAQGH